ncbi:MAG TPA: DUF5131 family protein [Oscillospiraceae bacterium]|nr:DUF5131 family protein [Oscillospiraceae bacterium]
MAMWNPWRGCHRYSEGCKFCYIHKGDAKRGVDTNLIIKSDKFNAPVAVNKKGEYAMKSGQMVYCCFSSDFLIEEADEWRNECWKMIKQRPDLHFIFLTKRIERFEDCIPADWNDGYENVTVGCTVENQEMVDLRLAIFSKLPIKHRNIILQPLLEAVNIEKYLDNVELVVVGGEYDRDARPFDYDWVLSLREQCVKHNVSFDFHQCGSKFIVDGTLHKLNYAMLYKRAREFNINYSAQTEG